MTTVAYRAGVLASDGQSVGDAGTIFSKTAEKIRRMADGRLVGVVGELAHGNAVVAWLEKGAQGPQPDSKESRVIVVEKLDRLTLYEGTGFIKVKTRFEAWGSGASAALAAMHMGADAIKAVVIACKVDCYSGGRVRALSIRGGSGE